MRDQFAQQRVTAGQSAGLVAGPLDHGVRARDEGDKPGRFADQVVEAADGLSKGLGGGESHHTLARVTSTWG